MKLIHKFTYLYILYEYKKNLRNLENEFKMQSVLKKGNEIRSTCRSE